MKKRLIAAGFSLLMVLTAFALIHHFTSTLPERGLFYDLLEISPSSVSEIQLNYQIDETETSSLIISPENQDFQSLIEAFDCTVSRTDLPEPAYQQDPLSIELISPQGQARIHLICTESGLYWKNQTGIYSFSSETSDELLKLCQAIPGDPETDLFPLYTYFCYLYHSANSVIGVAKTPNQTLDISSMISPSPLDAEPLLPMKKLIQQSDFIVLAAIDGQQTYNQFIPGEPPIYTHVSITPVEFLSGYFELDSARMYNGAPYDLFVQTNSGTSSDSIRYLRLGPSEHELINGQTYLFFLQENTTGDVIHYTLADNRFGIMEVSPNDQLIPLYNAPAELISQYYLSLDELKKEIGDQTFFGCLGLSPEEITNIRLTCQFYEDPTPYYLSVDRETEAFQQLSQFFDCQIKELEIPLEIYTPDPMVVSFSIGDQTVQTQFMTTEGETPLDSSLLWLWQGHVYELINSHLKRTISQYSFNIPQDPLYSFFVTRRTDRYSLDYNEVRPGPPILHSQNFTNLDRPLASLDEIIQNSDYIACATIHRQQVFPQSVGSHCYVDKDEPPIATFQLVTYLSLSPQEIWKGPSDPNSLQIRAGGGFPVNTSTSIRSVLLRLGISEQPLQDGQTYLFFLRNPREDDPLSYDLADFAFGIMKITEEGMISPIFNLDPNRIAEYYISLDELKDRVQASGTQTGGSGRSLSS